MAADIRACPVIEEKEAASTASTSSALLGHFRKFFRAFNITTIDPIILIKTVCHLIALRSIYCSQTVL
jgi:hypothetical protein